MLQVFKHAESDFKETDDRRTMIIIDEFARCKKLPVFDGLATLRNRKTSIIMCYQNVNQLLSIYSEAEVNALINLCSLQIYLSGTTDKKSTDMLSDVVGEYQAETHSYGKSILETKKDVKFSENMRPIITGKSLNSLVPKKEFIAIYFGEYIRARKLEYFNDTKYLKPIYEEISEFNKLHAQD